MGNTNNMDYHIDGFELIKVVQRKGRNKAIYKCGFMEMTLGQAFNYSEFDLKWKGKSLFQFTPSQNFELGAFDIMFSSFNYLEELIDDLEKLAHFKTIYYNNLDRIREVHNYLMNEREYWIEE